MESVKLNEEAVVSERLYYEDSHLREFTATVTACEPDKKGYRITLSRTAFFPEGGGQYADTGVLGNVRVLDVREKDGRIYHLTDGSLQEGTRVTGQIDFEERFSKMQQHTGEHIVSGLIHEKFGYDNVGFHLGSDTVTMDFNGALTPEDIEEIERKANEAVARNRKVITTYPSKEELAKLEYRSKIEIEGLVRIVTVPGYDICACCAPHVKRTGEIGIIKLTGCSKYKGGTRVSMLCGFRALKDYRSKEKSVAAISVSLSAKPEKTAEAVERLKTENFELRGKLQRLQSELLVYKLSEIPEGGRDYYAFEKDMDSSVMREFVNAAMERLSGICGVFSDNGDGGVRYVIGSKEKDVREVSKALNASLNGRGGGKHEMVQGSVQASSEAVKEFINNQLA